MDKQFFGVPMELMWEACQTYLYDVHVRFNAKIHAFILMGNHFHLVITTPDSNLSDIMEYFQGRVAKRLSVLRGRSSVRFQARYKWSIAKTESSFLNLMAYVYLNPVRAGICNSAHEYPYSSLFGILGLGRLQIPICSHVMGSLLLWRDPELLLSWFGTTAAAQDPEKITRALKKTEFYI